MSGTRPGTYTVSCLAFDAQGNWGTASYTFAQGGDSPAIADPSLAFSTNKTICVSQSGDFADAPVASTKVTSIAAARSAMQTLWGTGQRSMRVLIRAGETFTDTGLASAILAGRQSGKPAGQPQGVAHRDVRVPAAARLPQDATGHARFRSAFPTGTDAGSFVVSTWTSAGTGARRRRPATIGRGLLSPLHPRGSTSSTGAGSTDSTAARGQ
jgi:hypothetical protein